MCNFISWIEAREKMSKKSTLYYLTDHEVFSPRGKKVLKDSFDNDCLGHGAIRLFFGLDYLANDNVIIRDREVRNFWAVESLPKELREKIQHFNLYWGKMFKKFFQNDDLCYIINYGPDIWKEKAWQQLLKQQPSKDDLCYIINYGPDIWKEKAWQQLLKQQPSKDDLRYIIDCGSDIWKEKACQQLLKQQPSNNDLCYIINYGPDIWKEKACQQLLKQQPSKDDLCYIIDYGPGEWRKKALVILEG
jgi:hypothetical protein